MNKEMNIGAAARATGLSVKAIRFYENSGFVPAPARTDSGYRQYSDPDLRRLRFVRRQMRVLGMPLAQIRSLLRRVMSADCSAFAAELGEVFEEQRTQIDRRISELKALRKDIDELSRHVDHCECEPGLAVTDCEYCPILDEEGGDCCEGRNR